MIIKRPDQAESPLFPADYEYQFLGYKKQNSKNLEEKAEFTALTLAKNAHQMYDYLEQLGAKNPNGIFLETLGYASRVLDVPEALLLESFWTRIGLKEEELYAASTRFNPKLKEKQKKEEEQRLDSEIVLLFQTLLDEESKSESFGARLRAENKGDFSDLEWCYAYFAKKCWVKTQKLAGDPKALEKKYKAFFYQEDKKDYAAHFKESVIKFYQSYEKVQEEEEEKQPEFTKLLEHGEVKALLTYQETHLLPELTPEKYKTLLSLWAQNLSYSFQNIFFLNLQKKNLGRVKSSTAWLREGKIIPKEVPLFYLIEENQKELLLPVISEKDLNGTVSQKKVGDFKTLFLLLAKKKEIEISFEADLREKAEWRSNHSHLVLNPNYSEGEIVQEFARNIFFSGASQEQREQFIQDSTLFLSFGSWGLSLPSDTFEYVSTFHSWRQGREVFQQVVTQIHQESLKIVAELSALQDEKEETKEVLGLQEEIEEAQRLEKLALDNVITGQENEHPQQETDAQMALEELLGKAGQMSSNGGETDEK